MRPPRAEEPEPDEDPDLPEDPETEVAAPPTSAVVPAVPADVEREYEYRVDVVTLEELLDGTTLPEKLSQASHDEWHLVEIIDAGDRKAILLRKRKEKKPDRRPLGFAPPPR